VRPAQAPAGTKEGFDGERDLRLIVGEIYDTKPVFSGLSVSALRFQHAFLPTETGLFRLLNVATLAYVKFALILALYPRDFRRSTAFISDCLRWPKCRSLCSNRGGANPNFAAALAACPTRRSSRPLR